jgi:tetratricopeptide (TPR) repeat protein
MTFLRSIRVQLASGASEAALVAEVYQRIQEAQANLQLQRYDEARVPLLRAIESRNLITDPAIVRYLLSSLTSTWQFSENFEEAIAFFSTYLSRYPGDSEAYEGRGIACWYAGRSEDAVQDFTRVLQLRPNEISILSSRGQVFAELGENERALADLNSALQILKGVATPDPDFAVWCVEAEAFTRNGKAFALAGSGDTAAALQEFDHSIRLRPENAWVYHNRGQIYDRAGMSNEASKDYGIALRKTKPSLTPLRKKHAQARIAALSRPARD